MTRAVSARCESGLGIEYLQETGHLLRIQDIQIAGMGARFSIYKQNENMKTRMSSNII